MTIHRFSLKPFKAGAPDVEIWGTLSRYRNRLTISYEILGDIASLAILTPAKAPTRQDNLWQTTCLELFIGTKNSSPYWEFNLSPSTHWNSYHFDSYRQGMKAEAAFSALPFERNQFEKTFQLIATIELDPIVTVNQSLEVGIAAVLQTKDGQLSYWALTHASAKADFHNRSSFIIKLP